MGCEKKKQDPVMLFLAIFSAVALIVIICLLTGCAGKSYHEQRAQQLEEEIAQVRSELAQCRTTSEQRQLTEKLSVLYYEYLRETGQQPKKKP